MINWLYNVTDQGAKHHKNYDYYYMNWLVSCSVSFLYSSSYFIGLWAIKLKRNRIERNCYWIRNRSVGIETMSLAGGQEAGFDSKQG
jgi:hypothetical protein